MDIALLALIGLVFLSGLFSASEIGLTAVDKATLKTLETDGKFASKAIVKLKSKPQRLLVSILVGNQVANILATVVATLWGVHLFGEGNISLFTLIFSLILVLFGSIAPKTLALRFPLVIARTFAYPLLAFVYGARPFVYIFELFALGLLKLFRAKPNALEDVKPSEIAALIDLGSEEGVIDEDMEVFMKQILKFGDTQVKDIMTLFKDISALNVDAATDELTALITNIEHTFVPVYEGDKSNVKGVINTHDFLLFMEKSKLKHPLKKFRQSIPLVISQFTSIVELFKIFRSKRKKIAIVVDEFGQTVGLVTMGDVFEEITGMHTHVEVVQPKLEKVEKGKWEADGGVTIAMLKEHFETTLPYPEHKTVAFVILEELKRFPVVGEEIELDGLKITIEKVEKNIIKKVSIKKRRKVDK